MRSSSLPVLYVFLGLIASGKSTLAERFAAEHGLPCYNTDRVRKELAGVDAGQSRTERYNQGIYTREFTGKTYQKLLDRAAADLASGASGVVLDGSYIRREERDRVRHLAIRMGARAVFVLCRCSDETVRLRLEQRARDPEAVSDGRWEIYQAQKESFQEPDPEVEPDLVILETEMPVDELIAEVNRILS